MTFEDACQFLADLSENWLQPEERVQAFLEWQRNASSEELQALDEWHKAFLSEHKSALSHDEGMIARNHTWLAENLPDHQHKKKHGVVPLYSKASWLWRAAVILIIVVASAGFWQYRLQQKGAGKLTSARLPLQPGTHKAVLTLANGQQIVLDNTDNGNIASQNGMQIMKLDSGLLMYKGNGNGEVAYNVLTTPRSGQFQLVLPDGSHVWLNSASSIRFPTVFNSKKREVELTGEGYFEINQDPSKPFTVKARGMAVYVLGTGFNVMAYEDEEAISTTLVHGSVKVQALTPGNTSANSAMEITPGQQASLSGQNNAFKVSQPDMEEVLAWKEGEFRFKKTSIQVIMRQIARWYDVQVVFKGDLSDMALSGVISRQESADQLLDILQSTKQVRFATNGNTITVSPYEVHP